MKKYLFIWIGWLLVLGACTSSSNESISLEDLTTKEVVEEAAEEFDELEKDIDEMMSDTSSVEMNHFSFLTDSLKNAYLFGSSSESSKLDRYELVHKEKIQISSNTKGIEAGEAELYSLTSHEFRDTILCKTAFYNWLDCFGSKCDELRVAEDVNGLPKMRQLVVAYETKIQSISSECGNDASWKRMKKLFLDQNEDQEIKYQFEIDCRGRLKWRNLK